MTAKQRSINFYHQLYLLQPHPHLVYIPLINNRKMFSQPLTLFLHPVYTAIDVTDHNSRQIPDDIRKILQRFMLVFVERDVYNFEFGVAYGNLLRYVGQNSLILYFLGQLEG